MIAPEITLRTTGSGRVQESLKQWNFALLSIPSSSLRHRRLTHLFSLATPPKKVATRETAIHKAMA